MKIVVAGYGPVGQAVECALNRHPSEALDIYIEDPAKGHTYQMSQGLYSANVPTGISDPDAVIVCVATPMGEEDGSCNTDHVEEVFIKYGNRKTKFLIKSAVDPVWLSNWANSHTKDSFTSSPEFLRGSHAHGDPGQEFLGQEFAIYGGSDCRYWDELFRACLPNLKDVKYCTLEQAAFSKYVENCFLATKVTFFNEMYKIFNDIGFEGFDQMVDAITLDPRIGRSHTQVPGPDGKFGYGGHCFPKDMAALRSLTLSSPLLDVVVDINEEIRCQQEK